jgi:hypothetical protein
VTAKAVASLVEQSAFSRRKLEAGEPDGDRASRSRENSPDFSRFKCAVDMKGKIRDADGSRDFQKLDRGGIPSPRAKVEIRLCFSFFG